MNKPKTPGEAARLDPSEDERAHCRHVATDMARKRLMRVGSDVDDILRERAAAEAQGYARGLAAQVTNASEVLEQLHASEDNAGEAWGRFEGMSKDRDRLRTELAALKARHAALVKVLDEARAGMKENGDLMVAHYNDAEALRAKLTTLSKAVASFLGAPGAEEHEALEQAWRKVQET